MGRCRLLPEKAALERRLPMDLDFDPRTPWVGCFSYGARDMDFWTSEVIAPTQNFLARGGAGKRMPKEIAEDSDVPPAAKEAMEASRMKGMPRPHGQGESKSARQCRNLRQRFEEGSAPASGGRSSPWPNSSKGCKGGKGAMQHPRRYGQLFVTNREGAQVCYAEPCKDNRAHACQHCLGPHPNWQCDRMSRVSTKMLIPQTWTLMMFP